ncbi:MAG: SsrA-binding protein SmpB [Anaerolineales bacterium]
MGRPGAERLGRRGLTEAGKQVVARNRKAGRDYFLEERFEAGIVLRGTEIKSVRSGQVSLQEAHVRIAAGEAWLMNAHIAAYAPASRTNHEPRRPRKLLLHRRELNELAGGITRGGYTVVPTQLYLWRGRAKLELALARGKRKYDKRQELADRDAQREVERALRGKRVLR